MRKRKRFGLLVLALIISLFVVDTCPVMANERITKENVENAPDGEIVVKSDMIDAAREDPATKAAFEEAIRNGNTGYGIAEGETVSDNAIVTPTLTVSPEHLLTEANVKSVILSMQSQFPEGMYWTDDNFYEWNGGGVYAGGFGCAGFVFMMSDAAFGTLPSRYIYSFDWDNFRAGDILRVGNDAHSVIILEKRADNVIVAEGNYGSSIHWFREIPKSEVADGFSYYVTRYPEDGSVPDVTPALNNWTGPGSSGVTPQVPSNYQDYQDASNVVKFGVTDVRTGGKQNFHSANGYGKVLIFGGIGSCGNTMRVMQRISDFASENSLNHTEIWAFDIKDNSDAQIRSACNSYSVGNNVKVINETTDGSTWYSLYRYCREVAGEVGLLEGGILYMPLVVYVDGEGIILDMTVSTQSEWEIGARFEVNNMIEADRKIQSQDGQIEAFVDRLYRIALGRTYDQGGLEYWRDLLKTKTKTGAEVAGGFFFSNEMKAKNLSNEDFVRTLYLVMMDRTADQAGLDYWCGMLDNGYGRAGVFKGFVNSKEFKGICNSYGITPGDYEVHGSSRNVGLSGYICRLYTKALGRAYDEEGINYWCDAILDGRATITEVSTKHFFHSKEFQNKNLSDEEYLKVLYRTFFDREYDQEGLDYWMAKRRAGMSRDEILYYFEASKEFAKVKARYGF